MAALMTATADLALYVHWPFCVSKCPYCDFNSHVRAGVDQHAWRAALLTDLAHEAALTGGRPLTSIFFGGGTPSLFSPESIDRLLAIVGNIITQGEMQIDGQVEGDISCQRLLVGELFGYGSALAVILFLMLGNTMLQARSGDTLRQTWPRDSRTMKFSHSGVACSAASPPGRTSS